MACSWCRRPETAAWISTIPKGPSPCPLNPAPASAGPGGDFTQPGSALRTKLTSTGGAITRPCWVFDMVLSTSRGSGASVSSYSWAAGTSMAAPAVAAVAALIKQAIVMGNWIPNDSILVAQILKISSSYSPPPPEGFISPMTWGIENNVIERFAAAGVPKEKVSFVRDTLSFTFPGPPSALLGEFRKYYGPTMNAFEAAEKNGRAEDLLKELEALFNSQNKSSNQDATSIPATFLRVTVAL